MGTERWPTFLIVGAPKAGTTSAYFYLRQHPDVFMSPVKEPHYFADGAGAKGEKPRMRGVTFDQAEYQALFSGASGEVALGEASTGYLLSPTAAARIAATVPEAKIIAILRNPAERAFSGYMMKTRNAREDAHIADAFVRGRAYIENSFYFDNLQRYFEHFPREQIGIFLFEEFSRNPAGVMKEIFRFLGVDDQFEPSTKKYNEAWFPKYKLLNTLRTRVLRSERIRSLLKGSAVQRIFRQLTRGKPPSFPAELRSQLLDLYREDIQETQELTGIDLSCWLDEQQK